MEIETILSIGGVLLVVGFLAYSAYDTVYYYLWMPVNATGVVSSMMMSCNPLYCQDKLEFYGGNNDWVFPDTRMATVTPGDTCHIISHGAFLDSISCKGNQSG